jgi:ring-1,2-phenylacetyl-CoA epoxidase subunit PaaE
MSTQFYSIKVKNIIKETADCVSISFDIPSDLKAIFEYKAGQYINVKKEINGQDVRRSYSICSAPHEDILTIAVKKVDGGLFSSFANDELKENDILELMAPNGSFCLPTDLENIQNVVCYCAGSGITPAMSILKTVLKNHEKINVNLFYGNKNTESIIFREELEGLKNLYLNKFSLHYVLSREMLSSQLFYGRIDSEKCNKFEAVFNQHKGNTIYYLCGPATMIFEVKDSLVKNGVEEKNIHFELFNTIGITPAKKSVSLSEKDGSKLKIKLDDLEFEFIFDKAHGNILDAALANGADLPFACKGGVCSTCKAKCEVGTVEMFVNYSLEPDEVAAGYVLTCQSYPTSDEVFINFDC